MDTISQEEILRFVAENDVKFIRLTFSDMRGRLKNIAIMPSELPRAFAHGIPVDAAGFSDCPEDLLEKIPEEKRQALLKVLSHDPRPGYQSEASRVYGMAFAGYNVKFQVSDRLLTVTEIEKE